MKNLFTLTLFSVLVFGSNILSFQGGKDLEREKLSLLKYSDLPSACLVDAIVMKKHLTSKGIEAEVLVFTCKSPKGIVMSHAVTVYTYFGKSYYWDREGSTIISPIADIANPEEVMKSITEFEILKAFYLRD